MTDQLPPANVPAERAVLGSVLRWTSALLDVATVLRPEDFYHHAHRLVFQAFLRLNDAGKTVDVVTVAEEIRRAGQAEDAPPSLLADLWNGEPTGANATWHAALVKEAAVRRHLVHAGNEIAAAAQSGSASAAELLEAAERAVFAIADVGAAGAAMPLRSVLDAATDRIEAAASGRRREGCVATGFADLDALLGALHAGEFTIVAARPSGGKSAMGVNLLRNAAVADVGVLFVSLEMGRVDLGERLLACESGIDSKRLRDGKLTPEQWERLGDAKVSLARRNVHMDDTPGQRMFRIAATARRLKLKHGLGLVIVDYLQLVEPENRREPRQEQVAGVSRRLKLLALELGIPVVAMAQLNRGVEERQGQRPKLSDLRESGALEQDADNVWLLHREESSPGLMQVIVAKQRNGPTGTVTLIWRSSEMRFENCAYGEVYPREM